MNLTKGLYGKRPYIRGRVVAPGTTAVNVYELAQDLDLNALFGAAGTTLDISSSSVADIAAGTGAQSVRIHGLDASWTAITEDVALNGTTVVTTAKTFRRVFAASVSTAGSGGGAAGDIYIIKTGSSAVYTVAGIPDTLTAAVIKIPVGMGAAYAGYYTVPAGAIVLLEGLTVACSSQAAQLVLQAQANEETDSQYAALLQAQLSASGAPSQIAFDGATFEFSGGTDIVFKAIAEAAGAIVSVGVSLKTMQFKSL